MPGAKQGLSDDRFTLIVRSLAKWKQAMWLMLLSYFWLTLLPIQDGSAILHGHPALLPIEVLGKDGTTVERTLNVSSDESEAARFLWLQVHGVRYPEQASVQINESDWIRLRNDTVTVAEPGKSFGGIGGGFATLELTVQIPPGTLIAGTNVIRFRFNQSDGLSSGYRVLDLNFLTGEGSKMLPATDFVEDAPESWKPPFSDQDSIQAGRELWLNAQLVASSLAHSPPIHAHCADCHAHDGRDLKYFNFSNTSIITRSCFHGLTREQGERIASYIRSLPFPNPGRPWNPPYQPGPGLDAKPVSDWAAGAGLGWVLDNDAKALPYLLDPDRRQSGLTTPVPLGTPDVRSLLNQIKPDVFRPDGNLNPREVPVALQLPDWSQWLPRIHPKDAWGQAFTRSEFAALYDAKPGQGKNGRRKRSLRVLLAAIESHDENIRSVAPAFNRWTQSRRSFLGQYVNAKSVWSSELTDKIYSTQLWQLMKTWEIMQEFQLEGKENGVPESRIWCNTIPAETAPAAMHIPNGPAGVGGNALTNEYLSASWYELQIALNSGNHRHRDRDPIDWVYLIGHFHDLYVLSHQPEPVRLLVAVTKAFQSTDPHLGPDDFSQGWRPDEGVDPRIMISPKWKPVFTPFPPAVRKALTESLLGAWIDKNLQYPIADYLPLPAIQRDYKPHEAYSDISGGKVWSAAGEFLAAGVSADVVDRLRDWGIAYTDRAARLQYH
jgi:hypothetical protein